MPMKNLISLTWLRALNFGFFLLKLHFIFSFGGIQIQFWLGMISYWNIMDCNWTIGNNVVTRFHLCVIFVWQIQTEDFNWITIKKYFKYLQNIGFFGTLHDFFSYLLLYRNDSFIKESIIEFGQEQTKWWNSFDEKMQMNHKC